MEQSADRTTIEERLSRIEARLDGLEERRDGNGPPRLHPAWPFTLGIVAAGFGYLGLGLPQHFYQPLFAGLLLLLAYHRRFLLPARGAWRWPLTALNFLLLCLLFKLLVGGGVTHPFDWLKVPAVAKVPPSGDGSWYQQLVPDITVQWQAVPRVSDWSMDLTRIQTLLLIATLAGALFRFQPFTSFTALALLVISIPAYLGFDWDRVILFLVIGSVALYVQSRVAAAPRAEGR